jgi:hypothetical protein
MPTKLHSLLCEVCNAGSVEKYICENCGYEYLTVRPLIISDNNNLDE